jgi:hypothetical protein
MRQDHSSGRPLKQNSGLSASPNHSSFNLVMGCQIGFYLTGSIIAEFQLLLFIDQIGKICSPAASLSVNSVVGATVKRFQAGRKARIRAPCRSLGISAFQMSTDECSICRSAYD